MGQFIGSRLKKEYNRAICCYPVCLKYIHWTSLHSHQQGSTLHDVTYMWGLKEKVKLIELGSRKVIARDWGGGNRERLVNGYKLSVLR